MLNSHKMICDESKAKVNLALNKNIEWVSCTVDGEIAADGGNGVQRDGSKSSYLHHEGWIVAFIVVYDSTACTSATKRTFCQTGL